MNTIKHIFKKGISCLYALFARLRWRDGISLAGPFWRRADTDIIIEDGGKLSVGQNVLFQSGIHLTAISGGRLTIGNNVSLNRNCIMICRQNITIGEHCRFGPGVTIYDHDHKFGTEGVLPGFKTGDVVIGEGCWIGANVTILRNTKIGDGSVIGAGTIVKGDIPAHSLVTNDRKMIVKSIENRD